jgi:hypothetical protein
LIISLQIKAITVELDELVAGIILDQKKEVKEEDG